MAPNTVKRPTDPYDPAWTAYRAQNPGLRLSLSAADPSDPPADPSPSDPPAAPDLSFIPESFKGEDGSYKVDEFKAHFDELASFKAQADEAKGLLPETPDGYAWALPDDFAFPEGFDPSLHQIPVMKEDGTPEMGEDGLPKTRDMSASDMINAKDPDLAALQGIMHKHGAKPEMMGEIAQLMAGRELRGVVEAANFAAEQKKALGPEGQSRVDVVKRSLAARMPAAQATAILDGIASADALRGIEAMLKGSATPPPAAPGGLDLDNMTPQQMIAEGMKLQMSGK